MKNTIIAGLVCIVALSGCTNKYQKIAQERSDSFQATMILFNKADEQCTAKLKANKYLIPLYGKIINPIGGDPTLAMLNNTEHVGDIEKVALEELDQEKSRCEKTLYDVFNSQSGVPLDISSLIMSAYKSGKTDRSELWGGKITYGEFNKRRAEVISKLRSDWDKATKQADAEFNNAMRQSQNQDNERAQNVAKYLQSQQQLNLQQQQIQNQNTNNLIQSIGDRRRTNCQSHMVGNVMQTNCN